MNGERSCKEIKKLWSYSRKVRNGANEKISVRIPHSVQKPCLQTAPHRKNFVEGMLVFALLHKF